AHGSMHPLARRLVCARWMMQIRSRSFVVLLIGFAACRRVPALARGGTRRQPCAHALLRNAVATTPGRRRGERRLLCSRLRCPEPSYLVLRDDAPDDGNLELELARARLAARSSYEFSRADLCLCACDRLPPS